MEENECDNADIMKMKMEVAGRRVVLLLVYVDPQSNYIRLDSQL